MPQPVILQVIPALGTGGAEQTTLDVGNAIVQAGWTSLVASHGGRMHDDVVAGGSEHITMPLNTKNPLALWRNAKRLESLVRERGVSVIHARSRGPAWSALIAARRTGVPFVTTYHGAYKQQSRLKGLYNSVMARSDRVIANSQWTAQLIAERNPFAKDRITIIPRGTDLDRFSKAAISGERTEKLRRQWGVEPGQLIVLHLARLTDWKGQSVLIDAAGRLPDNSSPVTFVLAGDAQGRDQYLAGLEKQIDNLGLHGQVILPGHCSDPAAAVSLADIVVVASTKPEAFGRAAVEAGALEKPVIVTDLGAVQETVVAGDNKTRTGWKIPPNDPAAMADALKQALDMNPQQRDRIGQRARQHVTARFSLQQMCRRTLQVYEDLMPS